MCISILYKHIHIKCCPPSGLCCPMQQPWITCGYLNQVKLNKVKNNISQSHWETLAILQCSVSPVRGGYHIGKHRWKEFLSLQIFYWTALLEDAHISTVYVTAVQKQFWRHVKKVITSREDSSLFILYYSILFDFYSVFCIIFNLWASIYITFAV